MLGKGKHRWHACSHQAAGPVQWGTVAVTAFLPSLGNEANGRAGKKKQVGTVLGGRNFCEWARRVPDHLRSLVSLGPCMCTQHRSVTTPWFGVCKVRAFAGTTTSSIYNASGGLQGPHLQCLVITPSSMDRSSAMRPMHERAKKATGNGGWRARQAKPQKEWRPN